MLSALQQPSKELLLRSEGFLDRPTCKALRAAVDAANSKAANKKADSVDGLAEHQLDLTMDSLLKLTGPGVLERLRSLPTRFAASGGRLRAPVLVDDRLDVWVGGVRLVEVFP